MKIPVFVKIMDALDGVINPATSDKQDQIITALSSKYSVRIDKTSQSGILYIGKASIASSESGSVWQIAKVDTSILSVKWADGNSSFDNVWDNRLSLTYL